MPAELLRVNAQSSAAILFYLGWANYKLKNVSDQSLPVLQVNAVFRRVNDPTEWGAVFLAVPQSGPLQPGGATQALTIKSRLGYTGEDPRADMLKNSSSSMPGSSSTRSTRPLSGSGSPSIPSSAS